MLLEQLDIEYRIPIPFDDGFYYWTHSWIYDLDNPPPDMSSFNRLQITAHLGILSIVRDERFQMTRPPYSGTPYRKENFPGHPHSLVPAGESWSLFDTVRLSFYSNNVWVGYKRWRVPLRDIDIEDGRLSSSMYGHFLGTIAPGILAARICSREGLPVDRVEVSPLVHQWQWRHGSKRRTRHVIVIP